MILLLTLIICQHGDGTGNLNPFTLEISTCLDYKAKLFLLMLCIYLTDQGPSLKPKCHHFDESFITGLQSQAGSEAKYENFIKMKFPFQRCDWCFENMRKLDPIVSTTRSNGVVLNSGKQYASQMNSFTTMAFFSHTLPAPRWSWEQYAVSCPVWILSFCSTLRP